MSGSVNAARSAQDMPDAKHIVLVFFRTCRRAPMARRAIACEVSLIRCATVREEPLRRSKAPVRRRPRDDHAALAAAHRPGDPGRVAVHRARRRSRPPYQRAFSFQQREHAACGDGRGCRYRPVSAIYPPAKHPSAKVRSLIDFLAARFEPEPPWDEWRKTVRSEKSGART